MPDPSSWLHEATATAAGGHVRTDDGGLSSPLASPLAPHCTGLTPEQLLAAAFASCLHHAAIEAAGEITDEAHTVQVRAEARLGRDDDGRYRADVHASISSAGLSPQQLAQLVEHADRLWPFSSGDSTRHRLTVTPAENGGR
ncbi:OsmC family protein [Micromonospora sp. NBC_01412]|uniref:OsmC family protein n=1 Tax=Micromonospora sp. NBC_01412 TaxID=2903590 RepID=UPI00324376B0